MREFPHTGTFQKQGTGSNDGFGDYNPNGEWQDVITTECLVTSVSSREYALNQQLTAPADHSIYYPYQECVTADMRFVWHDRNKVIDLQSSPLDQGGQGEVMLVKGAIE